MNYSLLPFMVDSRIPVGTLSKSFQGNFLECINLTLNGELCMCVSVCVCMCVCVCSLSLTSPSASATNYVDLDLTMTAHSILIVTPGVGVFEVLRDFCTCIA